MEMLPFNYILRPSRLGQTMFWLGTEGQELPWGIARPTASLAEREAVGGPAKPRGQDERLL